MAAVVVLEYVADPRAQVVDNPYTALLCEALETAGVHVAYFTWWRALAGRADVHHIHWPEQLVRHESGPRRWVKCALAVLLIARLRLQRIPVVRTLHNTRPHEGTTRFERWFLSRVDRLTVERIVMNDVSAPASVRAHLVAHGHYRTWLPPQQESPEPGRLIAFGLLRPYKGFDRLIAEFTKISDSTLQLHVVGRPASPQIAEELTAHAAQDPRVTLDLRFVSDDLLAAAIAHAEIVVLPYRDMNNSGAALLALSCHRPIIVPDTPATRLLEKEFGAEWVCRMAGEGWDAAALRDGISRLQSAQRRFDGPDMSSRDWAPLGIATAEVLKVAIRGRNGVGA